MRQQMSGLDSVLQDALSNMGDSLTLSLQNLTSVFQTQNQRMQQLIDEQQQALADSLRIQQDAINEKIGQINNPFEGVKDAFAEGLNSIKETFELQNVTIQEMLSKQNSAFEEALRAQQEIVLQKLQNAPNQLQALTDISLAVERLNQNIIKLENSHQGQISRIVDVQVPSDNEDQPKKSLWAKCKALLVPICAFGSFLTLLGILLLQLFGS